MRKAVGMCLSLACLWAAALGLGYQPARVSYVEGRVAFASQGDVDWSAAVINLPVREGDRFYVDEGGRVEIEWTDGTVIRLGSSSDLEIVRSDVADLEGRLTLGQAVVRLARAARFDFQTPQGNVHLTREGVYRLDVAEQGAVELWVRKGDALVTVGRSSRSITTGQWIQLSGGGLADLTTARLADSLDLWSDRRDAQHVSLASAEYLPSGNYSGVYELERYGRWSRHSRFGDVWFPSVSRGWSPYARGRWLWRSNWGWTWVSDEPWGWLPYHHGRWYYDPLSGWGWTPTYGSSFGYWSPALVRFFYGNNYVSWCPLGPGDSVNFYNFNNVALFARSPIVSRGGGPSLDRLVNRNAPGAVIGLPHDQFAGGGSPSVGRPLTSPGGLPLEGQPMIDPLRGATRTGPPVSVPREIQVRRSERAGQPPAQRTQAIERTEAPVAAAAPGIGPNVTFVPQTTAPPAAGSHDPEGPRAMAPTQSTPPKITIIRSHPRAESATAPRRSAPPRVEVVNPSRPAPSSGNSNPTASGPAEGPRVHVVNPNRAPATTAPGPSWSGSGPVRPSSAGGSAPAIAPRRSDRTDRPPAMPERRIERMPSPSAPPATPARIERQAPPTSPPSERRERPPK